MNRRAFIQLAGVAGTGVALGFGRTEAGPRRVAGNGSTDTSASGVNALLLPDSGWRMWPDVHAEWQHDRIFLPGDVGLAALPSNPPTGGWAVLGDSLGTEVTLPATVEQFHWGLAGFRPYHNEYKFEATDDEVRNGAYYGVSWWWRDVSIREAFMGRRILLHVRGARCRAEVYVNEKLVGYSILEELPFECDLSRAAHAGVNRIAIRITNPGGRLDWVDGSRIEWGGVTLQKSHGFGGLDRGLRLSVHGSIRIADAWVLNTPEPRTISAHAEVENASDRAEPGRIRWAVIDPDSGAALAESELPIVAPPGTRVVQSVRLEAPTAQLWDLDAPRLYRLRTVWIPDAGGDESDQRETEFGFRWFTTDGLGRDAVFRLNGRRVRLYTSISWGYWALNGLFPTPELAEKEVRAAKAFNLNCLNFHRNLAKEEVLRIQDREGLLRCLEPGGGAQAIPPRGRMAGFAERYMRAKIVGMIRAFRSHPSVVHYVIQNEGRVDPDNPALLELFGIMRAEDPSRSIVRTDGFVMRTPQAWEAAYSDDVRRSKRPATLEGGAAGWWVDHSGHSTDVWQDACYVSPRDYTYRSPNRTEIVEWGEMKGPASSDNHVSVLQQIRSHGGTSYDRRDHEQILAAYDAFLDRWGFRSAFPSASDLFRSIGRRAYESWAQFLENVRISDETDMAAISGWESTAIENHSGLVDNFRDFKSDPRPIAGSLLPIRPLAKQRQLVLAAGDRAIFDLYLLNDSCRPVQGELALTLTGPDGRVALGERAGAPGFVRDRFSYLLREAVASEPLVTPGIWRARFDLAGMPETAHERELLVVGLPPAGGRPIRVALADVSGPIAQLLRAIPGVSVSEFERGGSYDLVVWSGDRRREKAEMKTDSDGANLIRRAGKAGGLPDPVFAAVKSGLPLLAVPATEGAAIGVALQLSNAGAFGFDGMVGTCRASWMGAWYFVRRHPLYEGMPVNEAMGSFYQVKSGGSNGWRVSGEGVEIAVGFGRDHDRHLGAGTLVAKLGSTPIVLHHVTGMHPVLQRRFLSNAIRLLRA